MSGLDPHVAGRLNRRAEWFLPALWTILALSLILNAGIESIERHTHDLRVNDPGCTVCLTVGVASDSPPVPIASSFTNLLLPTPIPLVRTLSAYETDHPYLQPLRGPPAFFPTGSNT